MSTDRIEKKVLLRAPMERVWRAISDSEEFGTWFGMKFDGPFIPGAKLRGSIVPTKVNAEVAKSQEPYEGMAFDIFIETVEPEQTLSYRWHPYAVDPNVNYSSEPTTLVVFSLEKVPEGVLLTVTESGFGQIPLERRAQAFKANDQGWGMVMKLVEEYLVDVHAQ